MPAKSNWALVQLLASEHFSTKHYDPLGNLTNVNYAVSLDVTLAYDALNRLTNMVDAIGTTKYAYSAAGQLASEDGPWSDDTVSYSYQQRLRTAASLAQPGASPWTVSYGYDADKRLTEVTSPAGLFAYTYDFYRWLRVWLVNLPGGGLVENYHENAADTVGRLNHTRLYSPIGYPLNLHTYGYNVGHQRTAVTNTAGDYRLFTYDNIGQLRTASGKESDATTARLHEQFAYGYDAAGNLNHRTNHALVQTFNVNALNQLTSSTRDGTFTVAGHVGAGVVPVSVTVSGTGLSSGAAELYADNTWARAGATLADGNNSYTAEVADHLSRTAQDNVTVNLPAANAFVYDLNGNLRTNGNRVLEYDDENQLTSVTVSNAWRSEFGYDGKLRRRVRKEYTWQSSAWVKTNEVRYVYDGNLVLQERNASNVPQVTYTRGKDLSGSLEGAGGIGGLLARTDNALIDSQPSSAHAFYHADGNGNVTALVNAAGAVAARYWYDPYGNLLSASGPLAGANTYRFSSKELHPNSGLVYYLYRCYDPSLQRWLNRDPIHEFGFLALKGGKLGFHTGSELNLYTFVGNNPLSHTDSFGLYYVPPRHEIKPYFPFPKCTKDCVVKCLKASMGMRAVCVTGCLGAGPEYVLCVTPCLAAALATQAACTALCMATGEQ